MKITFKITLLVLICSSFQVSYAQRMKQKLADGYFDVQEYNDALILYKEISEGKKNNEHSLQRLAECYSNLREYNNARVAYENLIKFGTSNAQNYYEYSKFLRRNEQYQEADEHLQLYYTKAKLPNIEIPADYYVNLRKEADTKMIKNWSGNSSLSDFAPIKSGNYLYFVSGRNGLISQDDSTEKFDIYKTKLGGNSDVENIKFYSDLSANAQDGPIAFDLSGKLFVTTNRSLEGFKLNQLKLVILANENEVLAEGMQFPFNNDTYSVGHATFSKDGKTIYFISTMPGSVGLSDIWKSIETNGEWSKPINLGDQINSIDKELFPYIAENGDLYFASEGHLGLGGLDLYVARKNGEGFSKPENLGYPINTQYDDFTYSEGLNKNQAFFTSNRPNGMGKDDIYEINYGVDEVLAQEEEIVLDKAPLIEKKPELDIVSKVADKVVEDLSSKNVSNSLNNFSPIYYGLNAIIFTNGYKSKLKTLAKDLNRNKQISIVIAGHADSQGEDNINQSVSEKRAKGVYNYLISKGVSSTQLSYKGYGESKLVNKCQDGVSCTETEMSKNRRVEFLIEK